uniref:Uncharacterized protein n=1 Tax=Ixodes ricinus TaxID=34613 RepID=A0A6B0UP89_IXORI
MWYRVAIWHCSLIWCSIVPTGSPVSVFFWYHVEWGRPRTRRRPYKTKFEHVVKLVLGNPKTVGCQTSWSCENRGTLGLNVMGNVVLHAFIRDWWAEDLRKLVDNVLPWSVHFRSWERRTERRHL